MKKRPLSGAALQKHLTKQIRDLNEFNRETIRIIRETESMKRRTRPLYRFYRCFGWGVLLGSMTGVIVCIVQPQHISTGILLGFSWGLGKGWLEP